jgi:ribosomal-protein-alanine N-acetyltransferase
MEKTSIKTKRLNLKTIDQSSAAEVLDYYQRNKDFLNEWEASKNEEYFTLNYQIKLLKMQKIKMENGTLFRFWIYKKNNNKLIGSIAFNNIIRGAFQSCHLGYKLDKDEINQGYMTEALNTAIEYAFKELKLHRIEANIMPKNKPSFKVVEKLGFINEGISRKYLKINNSWEDHIHMVLLNEDLE